MTREEIEQLSEDVAECYPGFELLVADRFSPVAVVVSRHAGRFHAAPYNDNDQKVTTFPLSRRALATADAFAAAEELRSFLAAN